MTDDDEKPTGRPPEVLTVREHEAFAAEVRRAVDLATENAGSKVALREYIEALFAERATAVALAEREREAAAAVLRETERLAATALADSLSRSIAEGDEGLERHIVNQISQIAAALASAEKLSGEQNMTVGKQLNQLRDEMVLRDSAVRDLLVQANAANDLRVREAFAASEKAIEKAEQSSDKRFDQANETKDAMANQITAHRDNLSNLIRDLMPREVAESQMVEVRARIDANSEKITETNSRLDMSGGELVGGRRSVQERYQQVNASTAIWMVGLSVVTILVYIALATHGFTK